MQIFNPSTYRNGWNSLVSRWQWTKDRFFIGSQNASILGTDKPTIEIDCNDALRAYIDCPHLRTVIDRKAEFFSNGEWKCVSIIDEEQEFPDDPGLALLNNPNPLQSREDFLFTASFNKSLFANNFIYKLQGSSLVAAPKVMWHLPSDEMEIKFKNMRHFFNQVKLEDIIDSFLLCLGTEKQEFAVNDIIYKAENFSFKEGKGVSRIPSLKLPINNLMASLKTRNVLSVNFGVKGIVSSEGTNALGPMPIKTTDKEIIQEQHSENSNLYSNSPKMRISSTPIKFTQISGDLKDMELLESEIADFMTICDMFGMRKDIFSQVVGSTFENQRQAEIGTYQSTIFQDADSFSNIMTKALNPPAGRKYILTYDWLPIMKQDENKEAATRLINTNIFEKLFNNGIISDETFAELAEVEKTGDGIPKGISIAGAPDSLGKTPLALQQLSLSRDRIAASGNLDLLGEIDNAISLLTAQLIDQVTVAPQDKEE